jgi:hypothetical protein
MAPGRSARRHLTAASGGCRRAGAAGSVSWFACSAAFYGAGLEAFGPFHDEPGFDERQRAASLVVGYDLAPEIRGAPTSRLQHRRAEVDPGQPHIIRKVGQVQPRPDRNLQHVPGRLRVHPLPTAAELQPLEESNVAVVPRRVLVPQSP